MTGSGGEVTSGARVTRSGVGFGVTGTGVHLGGTGLKVVVGFGVVRGVGLVGA